MEPKALKQLSDQRQNLCPVNCDRIELRNSSFKNNIESCQGIVHRQI